MKKKILIVYVSVHHGNTEKIVKAIAKILKADLINPHQIDKKSLSHYDIIGFGSGIFFWRHHPSLLGIVDKMKGLKNKKVFIFSTRGAKGPWKQYHKALRKKLEKNKCKIIAEFSCLGWDTVGPLQIIGGINRGHPDKKDLEKARAFARKLVQ